MKLNDLTKLHDWEIVTVSTDISKKLLTIEVIQPENDKSKKVEFIDVHKMYISDMKLQNVILDVMVFKEKSDSDYFDHCIEILNIAGLDIFPQYTLIYFEPSIGAEVACLCREINILNT